jgi:hypothetical protein
VVGPSDRAYDPVMPAALSLVTGVALKLSGSGRIPVPVTAWYHEAAPIFADCLALARGHLWCARYVVNSGAEPEVLQLPREAFEPLLARLPLAA